MLGQAARRYAIEFRWARSELIKKMIHQNPLDGKVLTWQQLLPATIVCLYAAGYSMTLRGYAVNQVDDLTTFYRRRTVAKKAEHAVAFESFRYK